MPDLEHVFNALPFAARDPSAEAALPEALAGMLAGCRDRLAHWVASAIGVSLGTAGDDLLGMADRATSLEQQQLYFAAMQFLADHGPELLTQFRRSYAEQFDAGIAALRRGALHADPGVGGDSSLFEPADHERDLALGKVAARAACHCAEQLGALDRRLAALLGLARVDQDANPLYPRALFAAMLRAFRAAGAAQPLALTILEEVERQVSVALPTVYEGLNRHLADCGVLPALAGAPRVAQVSEAVAGVPAPGPAVPPPGDPDREAHESALAGLSAAARFEDAVFGRLAQAITTATRSPRGRRDGPPVPAFGLAQLIAALTGLQRGRFDPRHLPGLDPGDFDFDPDPAKVLQQLRGTPLASGAHPVDAMTIDVVAMLFEAILADPDLSAALRTEIARLQVPVLKVALMDKAFFSKQRHPARRLLDLIASAGLGRGDGDAPRLLVKVRGVVDAIVAGFDIDIDIFAAQVQRLEGYLADEEVDARPRTSQVVDKLARRDRADLAAERVSAELGARLATPGLPALVGDFLDRHWRQVLTETYVAHGDADAPWTEVVSAMDELLWSVAPKRGSAERKRLLTALPALLGRLRKPIEAAGLQAAWDPFFAQLIQLHMGALHKDAPADVYQAPVAPAPVPASVPASRRPAAPAVRAALRTSELIDTQRCIEYQVPVAAADGPEDAARTPRPPRLAQPLEVGDWVEFQSFLGTRKTLRLSWISELRGLYLFTNRQGENAMTLGTANLAEHLRKGTARVLSQAPITERAVAHLLKGARPAPAERRPGGLSLA